MTSHCVIAIINAVDDWLDSRKIQKTFLDEIRVRKKPTKKQLIIFLISFCFF